MQQDVAYGAQHCVAPRRYGGSAARIGTMALNRPGADQKYTAGQLVLNPARGAVSAEYIPSQTETLSPFKTN